MDAAKERAMEARADETQKIACGVAVFDQASFGEYVGGDEAQARRVVRSFLADTPERLGALRAALRVGDAAAIARLAHCLKGSLAFLAAAASLSAVGALESAALAGELAGAVSAQTVFERELALLMATLEEFLEAGGGRA